MKNNKLNTIFALWIICLISILPLVSALDIPIDADANSFKNYDFEKKDFTLDTSLNIPQLISKDEPQEELSLPPPEQSYLALQSQEPMPSELLVGAKTSSDSKNNAVPNGQSNNDLFTGAFVYSYPIEVPQGVNGLTPQISLMYNHHQTKSRSEVGNAWSLTKNYIYRDTKGTRSDINDDVYYLNLNGMNSKLIYVEAEKRFHTEHETYMHITTDNYNTWLIKTKDGTTYKFGFTEYSIQKSTLEPYTSIWYLNEVEDTHANKIYYTYLVNPSNDEAVYLSEIKYDVNTIKLNYNFNEYTAFNGYKYGTYIKQTGLLKNIVVENNGKSVRKYLLDYTQIDNTKLLSKITYIGSDGISNLPPVEFTYYQNEKGWENNEAWKSPISFGSTKDAGARVIDVNGDGLLDILQSKFSNSNIKVYYNNGNGFDEEKIFSENFIKGFVDTLNRDRGIRFFDINGDSRIDMTQALTGKNQISKTWINNGKGFSEEAYNLPSNINFMALYEPQDCTPPSCENGLTGGGISCDTYFCNRACLNTYYTCGNNWKMISEDSGSGYNSGKSEKNDDTDSYTPPFNTKCYKFFVDTPNKLKLNVDDDECFNGDSSNDGDSIMIAGLNGPSSDSSWLSTVPPLKVFSDDSYYGWYGNLPSPFNNADFEYSYITAHESSNDDFDADDKSDFANADNYIYCAPNAESCYYSNLDKPCGYGCYGESTEAFVQSGYYFDAGNWIQTIAYDEKCDDSEVSDNKAEDITLKVYEADSTINSQYIYSEYCEKQKSWEDFGVRIVDVNGDGEQDIIIATNNKQDETWLKKGDTWTNNWDWTVSPDYTFMYYGTDGGVRLADVNGDGLIDIVKGYYGDISTLINAGEGWLWQDDWKLPQDATFISSDGNDKGVVSLVDINADGFTDIVKTDGVTSKVWINTGQGWELDNTWNLPQGVKLGDNSAVIADINGDGAEDIITASDTNKKTWINKYTKQYFLKEIKTGLGAKTTVDYELFSKYDNTGEDDIFDLGINGYVVSSISYDNGMENTEHHLSFTNNYNYEGGLFEDKEFRGFNYVEEIKPNNSKIKYFFYQDKARRGTIYKTEIYEGEELYSKTESEWNSEIIAVEPIEPLISNKQVEYFKLNLNSVKSYIYGEKEEPLVTEIDFNYDNYGNIVKSSYLGDVSKEEDEKYQYNEYIYDENKWILNEISKDYLLASDDLTKTRETGYTYNEFGDKIKEEYWLEGNNNPFIIYTYDNYGNVLSVIDANEHTTQYEYDDTHTFVIKETNAKEQETVYNYDFATGNILSETDANGYTINYVYDIFGRKIKEIYSYDSEESPTIEYLYDFDGISPNVITTKQKINEQETFDKHEYSDGFGNIIQIKTKADNSHFISKDFFYDPMGRISQESDVYYSSIAEYSIPQEEMQKTKYEYDIFDRQTKIKKIDNTEINMNYDLWTTTIFDENNHRKDMMKDAYENIVEIKEYNNDEIYTTNYEYDTIGNLINIVDNEGNQIKYTYDTLGRKTSLEDPDLGYWTYEYDLLGNLIKQTDNSKNTIEMTYDELNRITSKITTGDAITYVYDQGTIGILSSIQTTDKTTNFDYDERLRIINEEEQVDELKFMTTYTYDSMNRLTSKTLPNNEFIEFSYDIQGNLNLIQGFVGELEYNEYNLPTKRNYDNNQQTEMTYDSSSHRLTQIKTDDKQELNYQYDSAGNVLTINDKKNGVSLNMEYDNLDRLIHATRNGDVNSYDLNYNYNSIGNIIETKNNVETTKFIYQGKPIHSPNIFITFSSIENADGCDYYNPICSDGFVCSHNQCIIPDGCTYNNPTCGEGYECMKNECILIVTTEETGCTYNNPSCDEGYDCTNNECVLKEESNTETTPPTVEEPEETTDDTTNDVPPENTETIDYTNNNPFISGISFAKDEYYTNDDLSLKIKSEDADDDILTYLIGWFVNDNQLKQYELTLSEEFFNKGDTITAKVVATDGKGYSNPVKTSTIIKNSKPVIVELEFNKEKYFTYDNININPISEDLDNDYLVYEYLWYVNDIKVNNDDEQILTHDNFKAGDIVKVIVTAFDGEDYSDPVQSKDIVILSASNPYKISEDALITSKDYSKFYKKHSFNEIDTIQDKIKDKRREKEDKLLPAYNEASERR